MHIYTLRNTIIGSADILNGKLICVHHDKDKTGHLRFIDITTKTVIWETTSLVETNETKDGIVFKTSSGSTYDFIDVATLVPTYIPAAVVEEHINIDFTVVDEHHDYRPIHYGDGYDRTDYEFSRDISEEEFIAFLKSHNINTRTVQEHPYQDYAKLEGSGTKWTYKWIRCYTD
ncbi:MAG: hypothetical protein NC131_21085 [Roseburia sp.]|nr:hypothetical protein [Roseburia sp.]